MRALYVLRRELLALLRLPQTYAFGAAYLIISGVFFVNILISTEIPDLAEYYSNIAGTLLVLVPIVAMRSFAEERRSGGLDIMLTWPVPRTALTLGKFGANTIYVWALTSVIWLYFLLIGNVASIPSGRAFGGFVGLLLMSMAFNALALMVSARCSSPTAAAFFGFGLLLFLWILEYAPGWIGDGLRSIGPSAHFEAFPRGALYLSDVTYFCIVTLLGLAVTVSTLRRERPGRPIGSWLRRGATTSVVILGSLAGIAGASDLDGAVDLTPTHEHTLTAVSRSVAADLGAPVQVVGFMEPLSADAKRLSDLVRQYRGAGANIVLEIVDPDVQPAKARSAGVSLYGQIVVEVDGRREVLDGANQVTFTSALHRLSGHESQRACFTVGHGERSVTDRTRGGLSALSGQLRGLQYEVTTVALAVPGAEARLQSCDVLVLAGARVAFLPTEIALISDYATAQGRLVVLTDPEGPRDQLNTMLMPWGISIGRGTVNDISALAGDPGSIVTVDYPSHSPATAQLKDQELPVILAAAVPLASTNEATDDSFIKLVRSSRDSWIESGDEGPRRRGPFVLAGMVDRSSVVGTEDDPSIARSRIGVIGSIDTATNRLLELLGNRQFVSSLVQWVAHEDDLIAAARTQTGFYKLVLTEGQKRRLIEQGIVFPAALILLPLPLALLRLKRG